MLFSASIKHCKNVRNKFENRIDAIASTQGERKFVRQCEKYSLVEKKKLGELDKSITPFPVYSDRPIPIPPPLVPLLIHSAVYNRSNIPPRCFFGFCQKLNPLMCPFLP